jgi:D-alanyl-D-alanine carboxypeptidase
MATTEQFDSDAMLTFFDELGKRVEKLKAGLQQLGDQSERPMKKATEQATKLNETILSMSKNLLGPVGLAAGFVAVGKSLDNFATSQLQLQNLARNTGFATKAVEDMTLQFRRGGLSIQEAGQAMATIGDKLQNVQIFREGSPFLNQLREGGPGGIALANTVLQFEKLGERGKAFDAILKSHNQALREGNTRWAAYIEQVTGLTASQFDALNRSLEGATRVWDFNKKKMQEYHDGWVNLQTNVDNIWGSVQSTLIEGAIEIGKVFGKTFDTDAQQFAQSFDKSFKEYVIPTLETTLQEAKAIGNVISALKNIGGEQTHTAESWQQAIQNRRGGMFGATGRYLLEGEGGPASSTEPLSPMQPGFFGRLRERLPSLGRTLGTDKADMSFIGTAQAQETQEDQAHTLHDIRDILDRALGSPAGAEAGPGASVFRPGIGIGGRSGAPGGPGAGTSGANYMQGALPGPGDLVTVDTAAGPVTVNKAAASDIKGTIDEMVAAGAPVEAVGAYNKRTIAGTNRWSQHAYGTAFDYGQSSRNVVTPGFRQWATQNPDKLRDILQRHNMRSGGDWKNPDFGHFEWSGAKGPTGGSVRGSTFDDAQTASGLGPNVPGIALPTREHLGKKFVVTTPDGRQFTALQTDVGPAGWTGRGIDINRPLREQMGYGVRNFPTDQTFKYELARDSLRGLSGGAGGGGGGPNGHLSAEVVFSNVPAGVRTNAEGTGFSKLQVTSTRQGQRSLEGLMTPGDSNFTPFVP